MEYDLFRVPPQITLEIIVLLVMHEGRCELSRIYNHIRATEPTIRKHLRLLHQQDVLIEYVANIDKRARMIVLSQKGEDICRRYVSAFQNMRVLNMA